jgi:hypothetical protein
MDELERAVMLDQGYDPDDPGVSSRAPDMVSEKVFATRAASSAAFC